jgi:two-component system, LytTR family, response regulator LytT
MLLRTLIVDDEPHAIDVIQKHIAHIPGIEVVGCFNNAIRAFQALQSTEVDLMFIDIKMPGLSGTDFIKSLKSPPMVVFTTAYQEYAVDGFNLNAIDYLLKPVSFNRFLQSIDKVTHFVKGIKKQETGIQVPIRAVTDHFLYLRIERRVIKINTKDILWIESFKDYIKVVTTKDSFQAKQKISVTEKLLPGDEFMRIHRSFIIPLSRIEAYHPNHMLIAGNDIPIGRNYKQICAQKFEPPL